MYRGKYKKGESMKNQCPKCKSHDLEFLEEGLDTDENGKTVMYYEFICNKCEATGTEWYHLEYIKTVMDKEQI
jgi:C4-type Zn-finger protein